MTFMARDESRHAGFINSSLKDFGLGVNLGDLKRDKLNCCQFRSITKESFSIVNHCSNMG